mmetsp:Transcript_66/g.155  ORF Transcript_66/g.155 Transcript_66/m.155 type:complete len:514 (+) Transcript_66:278-1819(+)
MSLLKVLDVFLSTHWRNALLSSYLLQILLSKEQCVAFRHPPSLWLWTNNRRLSSMTSPLLAGVNGDYSSRNKSTESELVREREKKLHSTPSTERLSTERRRKLVDRTNVYNMYSSPTNTTSNVIQDAGSAKNASMQLETSLDEEELCYLDDLPGTDAGQTCFISDSSSLSSDPDSSNFLVSLPFNTRIPPIATDLTLKYLPFIMPLLAYSTYEATAKIFEKAVELISNNNWVAVDGGQYQANIITPAINGLVVPSIALLFATMTSTTINTLRQRQLQIRTSLNTEANDLRMLSTMVDSLPAELKEVKNHLREYLIQYASRVVAESRPGLSLEVSMFIGSMDTEMNGFLGVWNKLSMGSYATMYVDTMLPASNYTISDLSPYILSETYDALTRLRHERSVRLSALQSTYPALHYVILTLLAGSICTVFLMETNQELLIFLSAIQLRILWSMLIGTFSALAVVNYDMKDPFRGSYNVAISVDQFYTIREAIMATIQMEQDDVNDYNGGSSSSDVC